MAWKEELRLSAVLVSAWLCVEMPPQRSFWRKITENCELAILRDSQRFSVILFSVFQLSADLQCHVDLTRQNDMGHCTAVGGPPQ